ncbi:MAG TPA: beta-ketoacyl-ACP synthase II [Chloroflexota bacterium]|jgi:beta-ketoacyl-acyl-carrier-protein synthase II|nr:beta-ketoacyl-ACP synthase II [Chloroflexota bacterium]
MRDVVVTGLGMVSPVGLDVAATWSAILAGTSGLAPITRFDPAGFDTRFAAEVKQFDPLVAMDRKLAHRCDLFAQYAIVAARQAVADAGLDINDQNRQRVGVLIGTGIGGLETLQTAVTTLNARGPQRVSPFAVPMFIPDMASGQVAILLGTAGPNFATVSACSSSAHALGEAAEIIRRGQADVMIAGGSESPVVAVAVAAFNSMHALSTRNDELTTASRPFDATRDGFVLGEGAAVLILEEAEHARARGAQILGKLAGYGSTDDAHHITSPAPRGRGAAEAMRQALCQAGLTPTEVTYVNAHGTGTEQNDRAETEAIKDVFGEHAYQLAVSSTKSMVGHTLGAAGALEASFCLLAMRDGMLPPTINLLQPDPNCDLDYVPNTALRRPVSVTMSNSFGFGGHNVSLLFTPDA